MGCYVIVIYRLFLGSTVELSMKKASGSTTKIVKIVKNLEIPKYRITFCHFPLCFM